MIGRLYITKVFSNLRWTLQKWKGRFKGHYYSLMLGMDLRINQITGGDK